MLRRGLLAAQSDGSRGAGRRQITYNNVRINSKHVAHLSNDAVKALPGTPTLLRTSLYRVFVQLQTDRLRPCEGQRFGTALSTGDVAPRVVRSGDATCDENRLCGLTRNICCGRKSAGESQCCLPRTHRGRDRSRPGRAPGDDANGTRRTADPGRRAGGRAGGRASELSREVVASSTAPTSGAWTTDGAYPETVGASNS